MIILIGIICLSVILIVVPLVGGAVLIGIFLYVYSIKNGLEHFLEKLWILLFISAFLGSYLGIPGQENIFLFRLLLIIQVIFLILNTRKIHLLNKNVFKYKEVYILLATWIVFCFLSLFWAKNIGVGFRYVYYAFEASCLIYLPVLYVTTYKKWVQLSKILTLVYSISILIGLVEIFTGNHLPYSGSLFYETMTSRYQPTGFLFNTNDFALFLAMFFPVVFYYLYEVVTKKWGKILAIVIWFATFFVIISTYSRLGILAIGICSLVIYVLYFKKVTLYIATLFCSYILVSELYSVNVFSKVGQIVLSSFTQKDASTNDRLDLYRTTLKMFMDNYLIGIGAGGVPAEISRVRLGYATGTKFTSGHNFFLEQLGGIGIFVLPLLLFFILLIIYFSQYYFKMDKSTLLTYIPMLIIVVFFMASVALSTIVEQRYLWLGLGLAMVVANLSDRDSIEK